MSIKKIAVYLLVIFSGIIFSLPLLAKEENNPENLKCNLNQSLPQYYNPIGCSCQTGSPFTTRAQASSARPILNNIDPYCYLGENASDTATGSGLVSQCHNDQFYSNYTDLDQGFTAGKKRECMMYCITKPNGRIGQCSECVLNKNTCQYNGPTAASGKKGFMDNPNNEAKCLPRANSFNKGENYCNYCINIPGYGDRITSGKKFVITLIFHNLGTDKQQFINNKIKEILSIEPFKYLHEKKDAFIFRYIENDLIDSLDPFFLNNNIWDESIKGAPNTSFFTALENIANKICTKNSDQTNVYLVYWGEDDPRGGKVRGGALNFFSQDNTGKNKLKRVVIIPKISFNGGTVTNHELGHAFCGLNDEYKLSKNSRANQNGNYGRNFVYGSCNPFTQLTQKNCFKVWNSEDISDYLLNGFEPGNGEYGMGRKSTNCSLMGSLKNITSCSKPAFNAVSASYCLKEFLGGDVTDYFKYTDSNRPDKQLLDGYNIYQNLVPQGNQ